MGPLRLRPRASSSSPATEPAPAAHRDRWFGALWPLAILFHLAGNGGHLLALDGIGVLQLGLVAAALVQLLVPSDRSALVLAVWYLLVLWLKLPVVGNHEIVLGLMALTVAVAVPMADRRGDGDWMGPAAPVLRAVLLVAYGFMALSKWNRAFFDPDVSCAVVFGDDLLGPIGLAPTDHGAIAWLAIVATAVIETAVPVTLGVRRLRRIGVPMAVGFHGVLALDPVSHVWDFSAALLPLFLLFASAGVRHRLDLVVDRARRLPRRTAVLAAAVVVCGHAVAQLAWVRGGTPPWPVAFPLWLALWAGTLTVIAIQWRAAASAKERGAIGDAGGVGRPGVPAGLWLVVALAAVNGASPYLEWRSAAAFNMYSNLAIVDGTSNHLLVPALRDVPDTSSVVKILDADGDPALDHYRERDLRLPAANLHRHLRNNPDLEPVIDRGSGPERVGVQPSADGGLRSLWETIGHKLAFRRAVDGAAADGDGPARCQRSWGPLG
ncbi:MAG: hypothetical protein AAF547_14680 [Actinomycetota bacterium]